MLHGSSSRPAGQKVKIVDENSLFYGKGTSDAKPPSSSKSNPATSVAAVQAQLEEENVPWVHGVAGFVAGVLSSVVTNPLDIAKTRLQTQHSLPLSRRLGQRSRTSWSGGRWTRHGSFPREARPGRRFVSV
jgi:hypothetical protein